MDSGEVGMWLEDCVNAAATQQDKAPTEEDRLNYCKHTDSLSAELASLLQEAMEMKWPFVPEKWQYKESVSAKDKTNLSDLISKHLPQLLALLKASIMAQEARRALAVVFLVDRFLYWIDESSRLLKITKLVHKHQRDAPVAPQLVIRQARVYLNSGKLQKAEYILSSLINNSGATGCWVYHSKSDRALVQAVSVQVRGMILQKLGLWLQAAELIWASLVGFYALPKPDKKGIGTSLGLLANILVSMNDKDFHALNANPDVDLSLLVDRSHRLLSAAEAAKLAVVYSQYASLYVLTNVATQGTCLLSHSLSADCPPPQRQSFLLQAKEAFEIGLLTKAEGELVTSIQELHTFLKAAYSLTVTHKWLGTPADVLSQVTQACQKALACFYDYCNAKNQDKDGLCSKIMRLIAQVKLLLRVEPFLNSDKGSFIPDSYRNIADRSIHFTLESFSKVMQRFQTYHESLCKTTNASCKGSNEKTNGPRLCITALGTTFDTLITDCSTEPCNISKETDLLRLGQPKRGIANAAAAHPSRTSKSCTSVGSAHSLSSSWQTFHWSSSGSPQLSGNSYTGSSISAFEQPNASNQSCPTTENDDDQSNNMIALTNADLLRYDPVSITTVPHSFLRAKKTEVSEAAVETLNTEEDGIPKKMEVPKAAVETLNTEEDGIPKKMEVPEAAVETLNTEEDGIPKKMEVPEAAVETLNTEEDGIPKKMEVPEAAVETLNTEEDGIPKKMEVPEAAVETLNTEEDGIPKKMEVPEAAVETLNTEEDGIADLVCAKSKPSPFGESLHSLSQLTLRTSSSSLSDSFSSQSSWEKFSSDLNFPTSRSPQPPNLSKVQTGQNKNSSDSDGSFCLLETDPSETDDSPVVNAIPIKSSPETSYSNPHPNLEKCTPEQYASTDASTQSSFENLDMNHGRYPNTESDNTDKDNILQKKNPLCYSCQHHSGVAQFQPERQYFLSQEDYRALLAGVCHECLLRRLQSNETKFRLKEHKISYCALHLKFSKATGLWTARETCVYIGKSMKKKGAQREAIWVQFLHQEERLSSYVGKDYKKPKEIQFHLKDVERQMTAQYYVTEFNKSLYDKEVMAQIFFIPSEALLLLNGDEIMGCITVEPYMLGEFVKLTNNTTKKDQRYEMTKYGIAFGHFTYLFSGCQEVVVDLQGWVTANGKGLTYLTDPQIHSKKTPKDRSNFADRGIRDFVDKQHGPECNSICQLLNLPPVTR
ncbi:alpha-protein kinase 1 [Thalassophryne amazonica]|uniref:alpha-protein kinase 1 n=1 Tax=Thalassophryne amazonica TaxID=390379 RepID=UPI00147265AC|nr:alpha-protein kinase 1 [Thalassophryne amazonica]XP_034020146.1 alpha-protein kinase 1 [Thalassophryne amazonica]